MEKELSQRNEELLINFDEMEVKKKIMLQCILCGKEYDPHAKDQREVTSGNYCSSCFKKLSV